jgi:hypothetical protein
VIVKRSILMIWTDARHNIPRIGRILMARGRDATDVAIVTSFGPCTLTGFKVITEEVGSTPRRNWRHKSYAADFFRGSSGPIPARSSDNSTCRNIYMEVFVAPCL